MFRPIMASHCAKETLYNVHVRLAKSVAYCTTVSGIRVQGVWGRVDIYRQGRINYAWADGAADPGPTLR